MKQSFPSKDEDQALSALFSRAQEAAGEPGPYLATRVLAHVKSKQEAKRKLRFWQFLSAGLACAFVLTFFTLKRGGQEADSLTAETNRPQVVMVKLQDLPAAGIASAEIELPEGVYFYSETFPGLKDQRELKLAWSKGAARLPFVVKSDVEGSRLVMVRFRDAAGAVLIERRIQIKFTGARS